MGKLPPALLARSVLSHLGAKSDSVVVGPALGEDSAVLRVDHANRLVSATTDPITGASASIGHLVVHVNANDVAASGADPKWLLLTQLYPVGTSVQFIESIAKQVDATCVQLGISIVGGHTELTPAVVQPVLIGTCLGPLLSREPILTAGARDGDRLVLTKGAALEGMSILCTDRADELVAASVFASADEVARVAAHNAEQLSVVADARLALRVLPDGAISSMVAPSPLAASHSRAAGMHDPTEGGVAGALHEVADASGKGFVLLADHVPVSDAARRVCAHFAVDPLELISSGALLLCVAPAHCAALLAAYREGGIAAADIGYVVGDGQRRVVQRVPGAPEVPLPRAEQDALWTALDRKQ